MRKTVHLFVHLWLQQVGLQIFQMTVSSFHVFSWWGRQCKCITSCRWLFWAPGKTCRIDSFRNLNVDVTGFFFKLFSGGTYISTFEDKKRLLGTKAMRARDRITAYIATNTVRTEVPFSIIGTALYLRCFCNEQPQADIFIKKMRGRILRRSADGFWTYFYPLLDSCVTSRCTGNG